MDAVDVDKESAATRALYGVDEEPTEYVGRQCLMARRLVERGVRFVQIFSGGGNFGESWDAHWDLKENHEMHCAETDKPIAGTAHGSEEPRHARFDAGDLARRVRPHADLAEDDRPRSQSATASRSGWRAAASRAERSSARRTSSATRRSRTRSRSTTSTPRCCTCSGLNHEKLTYFHNGRHMRLTDVSGNVIREIVA